MDAGFFRGTSVEQDARFSNKEKKLIESMQFPPEFNKKVDIKKVRLDMIQPWIAQKVTDLLGTEDDILIQMIYGYLEPSEEELCPKRLQVNLTPFLEKKTAGFVKELWDLLLSAQENIGGIPTVILEQKKQELLRLKEQNERAQQHLQSAQQQRQHAHRTQVAPTNGTSDNNPPREVTYGLNLRSTRPESNDDRERDLRSNREVKEEREHTEHSKERRQRSRSRSRDRHSRRHRHSSRKSRSRSRSRDRKHRHHHSSRRHHSRSRSPSRSSRSHHHRHHHSSSSSSSRRREDRDKSANIVEMKRENEGGVDGGVGSDGSPSNRSVATGMTMKEETKDLKDLRQQVIDSISKNEA